MQQECGKNGDRFRERGGKTAAGWNPAAEWRLGCGGTATGCGGEGADGDCGAHCQSGGENVRIGDEGGGAVGIDDLLGTRQDCRTDGRTDGTGDQYLGDDAQALELTGFAHGGMVTDIGAEDRHAGQVSAHHQQTAQEHRQGTAGEIEDDVAQIQSHQGDEGRKAEAPSVVDLAPEGGDHRRQNDSRCHDEDIVAHAQADLVVEDQVGHIGLDGDVEQGEDQEHDVQFRVAFGSGRPETVGQVFKIAGGGGTDLRLVDEEQTRNAHADDHAADDGEDPGPAGSGIQVKAHETAEDHQNGDQGHHGVDALHGATVGVVRGVRDPGVEGGIVGAGAEEGHDTVQNDDQADTQGHGVGSHGENRLNDIHPKEAEVQDADAPEQISAADQQFAFANTVGQSADQHRGHRGGHTGSAYHHGDVCGRGTEHLVNEHIEVHIFHDPGDLSHQGKQCQCHPESGGELGFHGDTSISWCVFLADISGQPGAVQGLDEVVYIVSALAGLFDGKVTGVGRGIPECLTKFGGDGLGEAVVTGRLYTLRCEDGIQLPAQRILISLPLGLDHSLVREQTEAEFHALHGQLFRLFHGDQCTEQIRLLVAQGEDLGILGVKLVAFCHFPKPLTDLGIIFAQHIHQ